MLSKLFWRNINKPVIIIFLSAGLLSCTNDGSRFFDSTHLAANYLNPQPKGNNQNYLLIGAMGRNGTGSVYRCTLDGNDCIEMLGGISGFTSAPNLSLKSNDAFGVSVAASADALYVGSSSKNGYSLTNVVELNNPNGAIYKCDLTGFNCSIMDTSNLKLITNDHFGSSIFVTNNGIYTGVIGRDGGTPAQESVYDMGSVVKCNVDGTQCEEIMGGKNQANQVRKELQGHDHFGSSLFVTRSFMYIGAKNKSAGKGLVFKCNLNASDCERFETAKLNLMANDFFGYSLAGSGKSMFVGAVGRDSGDADRADLVDTGAIFKCDVAGKNCVEVLGGQNQASITELKLGGSDQLGSAIAVLGNNIFIGAMGRKDHSGNRTGAVYKCQLVNQPDNTKIINQCIELIAGKTNGVNKSKILGLKDGDAFGSSIAIATLPTIETGFILQDIYKVIGKSSDSLVDGLRQSPFLLQLSVLCEGMSVPNNQVISNKNLVAKLLHKKNCLITLNSLTIDSELFYATSPSPLVFTVRADKLVSAADKPAVYTSSISGKKFYFNVTSEKIGTFTIGFTDVPNRFQAASFNFVTLDFNIDGKNSQTILDKSSLFNGVIPADQGVGFILPNSKQEIFHTIHWGKDLGKTLPTFKVNVYNQKEVGSYDITLIGQSIPQNCPNHVIWPLTTAIGTACGSKGQENISKGFILKYLTNLNSSLPAGNYTGTFQLQAINWHNTNVFQNFLINLNVSIPKK